MRNRTTPQISCVIERVCQKCSKAMMTTAGGFSTHKKWCGVDIAGRLWARVNKTETCWLWTGATMRGGYGHMVHLSKHWQTHRLSWFLTHGDHGEFHVLHTCDVPACCNPAHLYLGTDADNAADRVDRNRVQRGEQIHFAKLSEAQAREILALKGTAKAKQVAPKYGVGVNAVHAIWQRRSWTHLQEPA